MNLKELKEIFRLVEKTDFTEVEVVHGDFRVRIGRLRNDHGAHETFASYPKIQSIPAEKQDLPQPTSSQAKLAEDGVFVTSPFVGTFYKSPSPDLDPYVQVGDIVKKGQILCIVEAMKLMNEIEADVDCKIVEIYPDNAQAVEFGERLFRVEPV